MSNLQLNTITTQCFGITITFDPNNRESAAITSDMSDDKLSSEHPFNVSVDAIESLILAQFAAGIDIETPAFLEGVEVAYTAIANRYDIDDSSDDEDTITIIKERRIQASADETITYTVKKSDWEDALESEWDDEELALNHLRSEGKAETSKIECDIDEVIEEFSQTVTVLD